MHCIRNQNAVLGGLPFQAGRHIDSVTEYVVPIDDNIAKVHADSKFDGLPVCSCAIVIGHSFLKGDRTFHSIHGAGELDQRAVPQHLDDAASVSGNLRVEACGPDVA